MGLIDQIEEKTIERAFDSILKVLSIGGDDSLLKVVGIVDKVTTNSYWSDVIRSAQKKFEAGHPGGRLSNRFLRDINPKVRNRLLRNLIVKEGLIAPNKRHHIKDELGLGELKGRRVAGLVGWIQSNKRWDIVLDCWEQVEQAVPFFRTVFLELLPHLPTTDPFYPFLCPGFTTIHFIMNC